MDAKDSWHDAYLPMRPGDVKPADVVNAVLEFSHYANEIGIRIAQNVVDDALDLARKVADNPYVPLSDADRDNVDHFLDVAVQVTNSLFDKVRSGEDTAYDAVEQFLAAHVSPVLSQIGSPVETAVRDAITTDVAILKASGGVFAEAVQDVAGQLADGWHDVLGQAANTANNAGSDLSQAYHKYVLGH
jgi:hypothetical protein